MNPESGQPEPTRRREIFAVFGPNPDTNYPGDLDVRVEKLGQVIQTVRPDLLYLLGGQRWRENGVIYSEAERLCIEIGDRLSTQLRGTGVSIVPQGLETISQIGALVKLLEHENLLQHSNVSILSSWHQTLRAGIIFYDQTGIMPTLIPTFNNPTWKSVGYDLAVNLFAGVGYTGLMLALNKIGQWEDGGHFIQRVQKSRELK